MKYVNDWLQNLVADTRTEMISVDDLTALLECLIAVVKRGVVGEVIEMGCNAGGTSIALAYVIEKIKVNRQLHLADSFCGLPTPTDNDANCIGKCGDFKVSPSELLQRFRDAGLPTPVIHAGWFSDINDYPDQITFAFLDSDLYQSILDSLRIVYPRLSPGGCLIVHDYNNANYPGVRRACDDFFADKIEEVHSTGDLGMVARRDWTKPLALLQSLSFEISLGCPLACLHKGICPISDPHRWDGLDTADKLTDDEILDAAEVAYNQLGFTGWINFHYFNDPSTYISRATSLADQIHDAIKTARVGFFTNGELLSPDCQELKHFDQVWLKDYTHKRDWTEILKTFPHVIYDPNPQLDKRMVEIEMPSANGAAKRCRRMYDEMAIDYYGNGHICTGDWKGEVKIGNINDDDLASIVEKFLAVRNEISQEPMSVNAPPYCKTCSMSMKEGDCIIDKPLFKEATRHRGF